MHYYKHIDSNGNAFQYEATTRTINSANVVEISQAEYKESIAALPQEETDQDIVTIVTEEE